MVSFRGMYWLSSAYFNLLLVFRFFMSLSFLLFFKFVNIYETEEFLLS